MAQNPDYEEAKCERSDVGRQSARDPNERQKRDDEGEVDERAASSEAGRRYLLRPPGFAFLDVSYHPHIVSHAR